MIYLSLLVALVGLVVYIVPKEGKLAGKVDEIGRLAFACGLLVFLFRLGAKVIDLKP